MSDINSKIRNARKSLRDIYEKYAKELYDITLKIDKYLGDLEQKEEDAKD